MLSLTFENTRVACSRTKWNSFKNHLFTYLDYLFIWLKRVYLQVFLTLIYSIQLFCYLCEYAVCTPVCSSYFLSPPATASDLFSPSVSLCTWLSLYSEHVFAIHLMVSVWFESKSNCRGLWVSSTTLRSLTHTSRSYLGCQYPLPSFFRGWWGRGCVTYSDWYCCFLCLETVESPW